ncbi:enoyl-CoA hydratase-related protein [Streptomyces niveus]
MDPHFWLGSPPGDGQYMALQALMGPKRAAYYIYAAKSIPADKALEWGIVSDVLPREQLLGRAWELARFIADGRQVWALGEGAMAWITIAMLRLNAAFARHVSVLGEAEVHVTVVCPAGPGPTAPMQVWNHAHAVYGPAGSHRSGDVSANRTVDLTACLSYFLPMQARPLLVDILRPFEVFEPRHIGPDGVIRRRHFTGHDELIHTWAKSIGVPSEL